MRILPRVHLVGSGQLGFDMTHRCDCHVYLLDGGTEWALIDPGSGCEPERIAEQIQKMDSSTIHIKHLLLTHSHADHSGGAAYWSKVTSAKIYASSLTAERLEHGDEFGVGLVAARAAGVYPSDYSLQACTVDYRVFDGDVIRVGDLSLTVLETPGHSADHVSFLVGTPEGDSLLFGGDVVFFGGKIILQNLPDCSLQAYAKSVERLAEIQVTSLLPGHGAFSLREGAKHIKRAADEFACFGIPDNLT